MNGLLAKEEKLLLKTSTEEFYSLQRFIKLSILKSILISLTISLPYFQANSSISKVRTCKEALLISIRLFYSFLCYHMPFEGDKTCR